MDSQRSNTRLAAYLVFPVLIFGGVAALFAMGHSSATVVTHQGGTTVFRYAHWVSWLFWAGGIVFCVLGIGTFTSFRKAFALLLVGLVLAFIGSMFMVDKVTLSEEGFSLTAGTWFAPRTWDARFDDLSRIEIISQLQQSGRSAETAYYFVCHKKAGGFEKIPVNEMMEFGAEAKILQSARRHGIEVVERLRSDE